jgi:transcriptional antiterminator RfaH
MPAFWGVVRSLPKREAFAAERLRMDHGFEVFLPLVQTKRSSAPLFSGYFFCRIVDRWRSINTTFGVLCLVRVGDCPAKCPDHEIDSLKAMIDGHGYIGLPEAPATPARRQIASGSKVRMTVGPFGGMSGLYAGISRTSSSASNGAKSGNSSTTAAKKSRPARSIRDFQVVYSFRVNTLLSIHPSRNLVSNIGFGEGATHTIDSSNLPTYEPDDPLRHPETTTPWRRADQHVEDATFGIPAVSEKTEAR